MDNAALINTEEHKYWNSDSADYWVTQKQALDQLLEPWARLLLEAAELSGGEQIADIGCGTAVLAMAAARIWPNPVLASDIDEVAVDVARANAAANNLADRLICVEAAGFDHPELASRAPFDLVFANILKGPLVALAPDMAEALAPEGYAILSGILNEQADDVIEVYAQSGINLVNREVIGDWTTLTVQKMP